MYTRSVIHYPLTGKNAELRGLIEEHVKAENAGGGSKNAFVVSMLQPSTWPEGPAMIHAIQHDDFAAWEKHISTRSPSFQAYASKMQALTSRSPVQVVLETLVREVGSGTPNYLWQAIHTPQQGKAGELRRLLEDRRKTAIERGAVTWTLAAEAFGTGISTLVTFADMASLEAYRKGIQTDPATQTWAVELTKASAGPAQQVLSRIVVPFPA